jgi:uncharacterized membrane protein YesL
MLFLLAVYLLFRAIIAVTAVMLFAMGAALWVTLWLLGVIVTGITVAAEAISEFIQDRQTKEHQT